MLLSAAVRLGSSVTGAGTVVGVRPPAGGPDGPADSALSARSSGTTGGFSHTVLNKDPAGGGPR